MYHAVVAICYVSGGYCGSCDCSPEVVKYKAFVQDCLNSCVSFVATIVFWGDGVVLFGSLHASSVNVEAVTHIPVRLPDD